MCEGVDNLRYVQTYRNDGYGEKYFYLIDPNGTHSVRDRTEVIDTPEGWEANDDIPEGSSGYYHCVGCGQDFVWEGESYLHLNDWPPDEPMNLRPYKNRF
jgi:hypothetical protein